MSNTKTSLTDEQSERARQAQRERGERGPVGQIICDNCGDNVGQARQVDAIRLLPPRIVNEWWCANCQFAMPIERRLRAILPKEHDYE